MARFNPEEYVQQLLSQADSLPPDINIDDRDIPIAKNCIEFFHSEDYIGNMIPNKLFPRQIEMMVKLNAEYCPRCTDTEFFGDTKHIGNFKANCRINEVLDKIQLLEYGVCPKCGAKKSELYLNNELDVPTEFIGLLGQRSGKSAVSSMNLSYIIHKFLKTPNLQKVFNLLPSSPFIIPLVGLSFEKARELLYNALYQYLINGNWFKRYCEFLDDTAASMGFDKGFYDIKDTFTRFRHKNILVAPFGPDKRKLRGNTSIGSATDEVGWFIKSGNASDAIKFDSDEIYASVNNSLMTAKESYLALLAKGYNNLPVPININISSPSSKTDKICRLYEESKLDRYMYGVHLATWEVNPYLPLEGPTMQSLLKKHGKNFWRDFGAVPPSSSNAFIQDIELLKLNAKQYCNICDLGQRDSRVGSKIYTSGYIKHSYQDTDNANKALALDAGYVNNSFAIAVAELHGKVVKYNLLTEIIPSQEKPINYNAIYNDIILEIIKKFNIRLVCTDRWQNIKLLSDIENNKALNCLTATHSVNYGDFDFFKSSLMDNNIQLPRPEIEFSKIEFSATDDYPHCFLDKPVSHFYFQALTVVDMQGKTVTKGERTTDDIFRAAVLAHSIITNVKYDQLFNNKYGNSRDMQKIRGIGANASFGAGITSSNVGALPSGSGFGSSSVGARPN